MGQPPVERQMAEQQMNRATLSSLKEKKKKKEQGHSREALCRPKIIKSGKRNTSKAVGVRK